MTVRVDVPFNRVQMVCQVPEWIISSFSKASRSELGQGSDADILDYSLMPLRSSWNDFNCFLSYVMYF